jgi:hypothetical protein
MIKLIITLDETLMNLMQIYNSFCSLNFNFKNEIIKKNIEEKRENCLKLYHY